MKDFWTVAQEQIHLWHQDKQQLLHFVNGSRWGDAKRPNPRVAKKDPNFLCVLNPPLHGELLVHTMRRIQETDLYTQKMEKEVPDQIKNRWMYIHMCVFKKIRVTKFTATVHVFSL